VTGILVDGDNHFIVSGPFPDRQTALALVRRWSVIHIGARSSPELEAWQIVTRAFRENLAWAIVVGGEREMIPAVAGLLAELSARGVRIYDAELDRW